MEDHGVNEFDVYECRNNSAATNIKINKCYNYHQYPRVEFLKMLELVFFRLTREPVSGIRIIV